MLLPNKTPVNLLPSLRYKDAFVDIMIEKGLFTQLTTDGTVPI